MHDFAVPAGPLCVIPQRGWVHDQPAARRAGRAPVLERQLDLTDVPTRAAVRVVIGEMLRVVGACRVHGVEQQLPAVPQETPRVCEEPVDPRQVLHHAQAVPQHEQRMERPGGEGEDVGKPGVAHATLGHDVDGVGRDVDGGDCRAGGLECQRVEAASGTHIQHAPSAGIESRSLEGRELLGRAKEVPHRYPLLTPVATPHQQLGVQISLEVRKECAPVRGHRCGVHPHAFRFFFLALAFLGGRLAANAVPRCTHDASAAAVRTPAGAT